MAEVTFCFTRASLLLLMLCMGIFGACVAMAITSFGEIKRNRRRKSGLGNGG